MTLPFFFFSQALRDPFGVASFIPSGRSLSDAMASCVPSKFGLVVELGPGTGPVTQALLRRDISPSQVIAIESNRALGLRLRERFHQISINITDARHLDAVLRNSGRPSRVQAIVSSLGLRAMSAEMVEQVVRAADRCLEDGGVFVQYTYRAGSPVPLELCAKLGWRVERVRKIWRNAPPATVWRYWKKHHHEGT